LLEDALKMWSLWNLSFKLSKTTCMYSTPMILHSCDMTYQLKIGPQCILWHCSFYQQCQCLPSISIHHQPKLQT
jgi:hypothetical protein